MGKDMREEIRKQLHTMYKKGFEDGKKLILTHLSEDLQAQVLGNIDIGTMAGIADFESGGSVPLVCGRCGTKWTANSKNFYGCPSCKKGQNGK